MLRKVERKEMSVVAWETCSDPGAIRQSNALSYMAIQLGYGCGELEYSSLLRLDLQEWFNHVLSQILGDGLVAFERQRANYRTQLGSIDNARAITSARNGRL